MSDWIEVPVVFAFPTEVLHPKYHDTPNLLGIELVESLEREWANDGVNVRLLAEVFPSDDSVHTFSEELVIDQNLNINRSDEGTVTINNDDEGDWRTDDIFKELGLDDEDWDDEEAE